MRTITPNNSRHSAYPILVSDKDYHYLSQFKWLVQLQHGRRYAYRTIVRNGKQIMIFMHRELLGILDHSTLVDHKDGNGLNNQRNNIRKATRSQNGANRQKKCKSSSKYLGVSLIRYNTKKGEVVKYSAKCKKHGVVYLEMHTTEKKAARAYNRLARRHHGKFAKINII